MSSQAFCLLFFYPNLRKDELKMKETKKTITCGSCGQVISAESATLVNVGLEDAKLVCNECLDDCFQCSHCGQYYTHRHEWASYNDFTVCTRCQDHYAQCCVCSDIIPCNNAYYYRDEPYCETCYDDETSGRDNHYIEEYGYKPYPQFLGECSDNLYIGVELEVDYGKVYEASEELSEKYSSIYLKRDGSLERGFEIVSHPATLAYHTDELGWENIMDICIDWDMKSHNTSTCGLHCHVSRLFFGETDDEQDLHIAKLILLVDKFWDHYIVPFSRRNIPALDRWAAKPSITILDTDTEKDIIDKVKDTKYRGRYQGINLENQNTIEFRIFRGTLKLNTFIATLQFVDCICRYSKSMRLSDIYTVGWSDLFSGKDELYPELIDYLKSKNLI